MSAIRDIVVTKDQMAEIVRMCTRKGTIDDPNKYILLEDAVADVVGLSVEKLKERPFRLVEK